MTVKDGLVILADAHANIREGIRGLLEAVFEAVVMVADEKSLLVATEKSRPDLAVVDLSMPASGEGNILGRLKNRHPDLKVVVLSVHDEPVVVNEAIAAGALGFVLKRSAGTDLTPAVHEILQGRTYISPDAAAQTR